MDLKELRQLQAALKNTEGVTLARKLPKQLGLCVDFRNYQYRIDYIEDKWQAKIGFVEGPDLAELQALVPVVLKAQQDKEMEAIAEAEAAKAKAEEERTEASLEAKAQKQKHEKLLYDCCIAYIPGFNRQEWTQEKFGHWSITELTLEELQILWSEFQRRGKEHNKQVFEAQENARIQAQENASKPKQVISCIDAEELAEELRLILADSENIFIKVLWPQHIQVYFLDSGFTVAVKDQREDGDWFVEDPAPDIPFGGPAWRRQCNICKETLSQACNSIISRKRKHAEALRIAPEQVAELMRRSKAGDDEAFKPCPNCEGSGLCGGLVDGCECGGDCPSNGICPGCGGNGRAATFLDCVKEVCNEEGWEISQIGEDRFQVIYE
jgi:hypothetical protein